MKKRACVYYITDGEFVKIGVTKDLETRLNTLQTGNARELKVLAVIYPKAPYIEEAALHYIYKDKRIRGEWYDIKNEVEEIIKSQKEHEQALKMQEETTVSKNKKVEGYLSLDDICELFHISRTVGQRLISTKDFPAMTVISGKPRVSEAEFDEYVKQRMKKGKNLLEE